MKFFKYFSLFIVLLTFISCTSYTPKDVNKRYVKLSKELDNLMDNVIIEKKRASLEKEFSKFTEGMEEYKKENRDIDTKYLDEYLKKSKIKLQYIKDLRD